MELEKYQIKMKLNEFDLEAYKKEIQEIIQSDASRDEIIQIILEKFSEIDLHIKLELKRIPSVNRKC